jgi:hypothetical protein
VSDIFLEVTLKRLTSALLHRRAFYADAASAARARTPAFAETVMAGKAKNSIKR